MSITVATSENVDRLAPMKCLTGVIVLSYPKLIKPEAFNGGTEKYSATLLVPKNPKSEMQPFITAKNNAVADKYGSDPKKYPTLTMPWNDGDKKQDKEGYAGHWYINVKCKERPALLDPDKISVRDDEQAIGRLFYAGAYARASLLCYTYDYMGKRGVGFYLRGLQAMRKKGKPLSAGRSVENDFTVVDADEDDDGLGFSETDDDGLGA